MQSTESGFYFIDHNDIHSTGKPFHLEQRFRSKSQETTLNKYWQSIQRRETLLQARKQKLRNRQLHVQQVVSAQKNRLVGNSTATLTKICKTLKAAEEKRTSLLELQKQNCAEEVARAKKIAQEQQEKFQKSTTMMRLKIQERHKMAANRRQQLFSMPRSQLLDLSTLSMEEITDIETAQHESAVLIQQWYRKCKLVPVFRAMQKACLIFATVESMPFEKLVHFMKQEHVIRAGSRLIQRIKKMSSQPITWKNPSRIFLSGYMVATHPQETFPVIGEEEQQVQLTAKQMILSLEEWMFDPCSVEKCSQFTNALFKFYHQFEEWKEQDTKKIVYGMIQHWLELEKLWFSVRHTQGDAETEWKPKISSQQRSIQMKLARISKKALGQLKEEQEKLRSELGVDQESDLVDEPDLISSSACESDGNSSDVLSTSPGRFPVKMSHRRDSVTTSRAASPVQPTANVSKPVNVEEKPKQVVDLEPTQKFGEYLSNEKLAHELVRDPEFQLKKDQNKSELEIRLTSIAKKAFFDKVREEFAKGNYLSFVPSLLNEIKSELLSMVSDSGKMAQEINERLDLELIEQQIKHNVFDPHQCIQYVTSKMSQFCAPVRDESIRKISTLYPDLASMFCECLSILEEMKLDLLNFKLKQLRPILQQQAVEYEQSKFEEALASNSITLTNTKEWLSSALKNLKQIAASRNPESIQNPENQIRFEDIYHEALLNLIFSNKAVSKDSLPETLLLDAERLFGFQNELQLITILSALTMLAKNAASELRRDKSRVLKLRDRLMVLLKSNDVSLDHITQEVLKNISQCLQQNGSSLSKESEEFIKNMIERTLSTKDSLFSLITRRIHGLVLGQLRSGNFRSVTGMSLTSAGLDIVEKELMEFSRKICQLAVHNKQVHAKWYDEIIKSLLV